MNKLALIVALAVAAGSAIMAQETLYVSAKGGEDKSGRIEAEPTTFSKALTQVQAGNTRKIIILGTVDFNSNGMKNDEAFVFFIGSFLGDVKKANALQEIVITGKPGVSGTERAVLSGKGSGKIAVMVSRFKIRFEHIEISGGEGTDGCGLHIANDARVTLGPGSVIRNNSGVGIYVEGEGTCVMDGSEVHDNNVGVTIAGNFTLQNGIIRNNTSSGIAVYNGGTCTIENGAVYNNNNRGIAVAGILTLRNGLIRDNNSFGNGGGVFISKGGRFTISGGSITNNRAQAAGGGVYVETGARFDQNSGSISANIAGQGSNPNIFKQ